MTNGKGDNMKAQEMNDLIRQHLTPEWALFRGRTYRILEIKGGYAYLDRSNLKVALSEIEAY